MEITPTVAGGLVIVAILVSIAALVVGIIALVGQRRVKRAFAVFSMGSRDDVLTLLQRHIDEVGLLRSDVRGLRRATDEIRDLHRGAVSRVGTVRYDAFDDMGGRLSFSTALLDERGNGVVLTAINGRTDTRSYAKPLVGWGSRHNLSTEELSAIERAKESGEPKRRSRPVREPITADTARREAEPPDPGEPDVAAAESGTEPDSAHGWDGERADAEGGGTNDPHETRADAP